MVCAVCKMKFLLVILYSTNTADMLGLFFLKYVKVQQFLYRRGQAQRVPGGWDCQISRQSAHEDGKASPTHRPPLSPGNVPGTDFSWRQSRPHGRSATGRIMYFVDERFHWHDRESNPQTPNLQRSASTNCSTACPLTCQTSAVYT
jgi:hypothetical protein